MDLHSSTCLTLLGRRPQVIFFSTDIYKRAGLGESQAQAATLGMGAMNVLMTVVSVILVEKAGRKTLQLIGLSGMFITTVLLTLCLALKVRRDAAALFLRSVVLCLAYHSVLEIWDNVS